MEYGISALVALILSLFGGGGNHQPNQPNQPNQPSALQSQKQPQEVPEPTTVFGSVIALSGFAYLRNKKKLNITK